MSTKDRWLLAGEVTVILVFAVGYSIWVHYLQEVPNRKLNPQTAITVITLVASVFGSLLGFILAMVVFLLGIVENKNFSILRASKSYSTLWGIFKGALISCGATTLVSVLWVFLIWFGYLESWMISCIIGLFIWSSLRLARVVWVLCMIINGEIAIGARMRQHVESDS